jgi:hydrogenase small subunit
LLKAARHPSRAQELLSLLPSPKGMHPPDEAGNVAHVKQEELLAEIGKRSPTSLLGPLEKVHAFWLAGMSCDGCTIATVQATEPSVEDLMTGRLPGVPQVILHHYVLQLEAGVSYMSTLEQALEGTLDAPYVCIYEGSIPDERIAQRMGGYWASEGEEPWGPNGEMRTVTTSEWLARLAPNAAAVIAIGTCATWGGIPSADHNPTNSMSVADFLSADYRSTFGLPVINVPGCAPIGDNFTEVVTSVLMFLNGIGPLPEFDEVGRPAWLFHSTVHDRCVRGGYYEEGLFVDEYGDPECLVEVGCWGPVVQCNIVERGAINHLGGCMAVGGPCIGCTMPGFPDKFTPFYKKPPGSTISTISSRTLGSFVRPLRRITMRNRNREMRWDQEKHTSTGFGGPRGPETVLDRTLEYFYKKLQQHGSTKSPSKQTPAHERQRRMGQRGSHPRSI